MSWIKAVYKVPEFRQVFFIVSSPKDCKLKGASKRALKQRQVKEYCEKVDEIRNSGLCHEFEKWLIKVVPIHYFLHLFEEHSNINIALETLPSQDPKYVELLTMIYSENHDDPNAFLASTLSKSLSPISKTDVIEVFI